MHLMIRRSPRVRRNSKLILILLVLPLAGRNKILQVQASSATDARNPTPKDKKRSAKLRMPYVMDVVSKDITR